MKSSDEIRKDLENLHKIDDDSDSIAYKLWNAEKHLMRAQNSEFFRNNVLPKFLLLVDECIEKGNESFYIKLKNGKRFVYFCSTCGLGFINNDNKIGKRLFLKPQNFLKYFSFLDNK